MTERSEMSVFEILECARINFENLAKMNNQIIGHPFYIIAMEQLSDGIKRLLAELEALHKEQEDILFAAGAMTCHNGKQHEPTKWDNCLYCKLEQVLDSKRRLIEGIERHKRTTLRGDFVYEQFLAKRDNTLYAIAAEEGKG